MTLSARKGRTNSCGILNQECDFKRDVTGRATSNHGRQDTMDLSCQRYPPSERNANCSHNLTNATKSKISNAERLKSYTELGLCRPCGSRGITVGNADGDARSLWRDPPHWHVDSLTKMAEFIFVRFKLSLFKNMCQMDAKVQNSQIRGTEWRRQTEK